MYGSTRQLERNPSRPVYAFRKNGSDTIGPRMQPTPKKKCNACMSTLPMSILEATSSSIVSLPLPRVWWFELNCPARRFRFSSICLRLADHDHSSLSHTFTITTMAEVKKPLKKPLMQNCSTVTQCGTKKVVSDFSNKKENSKTCRLIYWLRKPS